MPHTMLDMMDAMKQLQALLCDRALQDMGLTNRLGDHTPDYKTRSPGHWAHYVFCRHILTQLECCHYRIAGLCTA